MTEQEKRISLELAKKFHEAGFDKPCFVYWVDVLVRTRDMNNDPTPRRIWMCKKRKELQSLEEFMDEHDATKAYKAYDLLNDLCVTHAKELFGRNKLFYTVIGNSGGYEEDDYYIEHIEGDEDFEMESYDEVTDYIYHANEVFNLMLEGKKEEAEKYFIEHCILFNKK